MGLLVQHRPRDEFRGPLPPHTEMFILKTTFYDSFGIKIKIFILSIKTFSSTGKFIFFHLTLKEIKTFLCA